MNDKHFNVRKTKYKLQFVKLKILQLSMDKKYVDEIRIVRGMERRRNKVELRIIPRQGREMMNSEIADPEIVRGSLLKM